MIIMALLLLLLSLSLFVTQAKANLSFEEKIQILKGVAEEVIGFPLGDEIAPDRLCALSQVSLFPTFVMEDFLNFNKNLIDVQNF